MIKNIFNSDIDLFDKLLICNCLTIRIIEYGIYSFRDVASIVTYIIGEESKKYIKSSYTGVLEYPGYDKKDKLTQYNEYSTIDLDTIQPRSILRKSEITIIEEKVLNDIITIFKTNNISFIKSNENIELSKSNNNNSSFGFRLQAV